MTNKLRFCLVAIVIIVIGALSNQLPTASAHERWFIPQANTYQINFDLLLSWQVLLIIVTGATITGLAWLIDRRWQDQLKPDLKNSLISLDEKRLKRVYAYLPLLLALHTTVPLLVYGFGLQLFAPNLVMSPSLLSGLFGLGEILIALALIYGLFTELAALALIVLFGAGIVFSPLLAIPTSLLPEHCFFVGIGAFFYIIGRGPFSVDDLLGRQKKPNPTLVKWAIPILRWTMGLSLLLLAFSEKLLNPALAEAFLTQKINFNLGSGFGISNPSFVYLAGFVWFTHLMITPCSQHLVNQATRLRLSCWRNWANLRSLRACRVI